MFNFQAIAHLLHTSYDFHMENAQTNNWLVIKPHPCLFHRPFWCLWQCQHRLWCVVKSSIPRFRSQLPAWKKQRVTFPNADWDRIEGVVKKLKFLRTMDNGSDGYRCGLLRVVSLWSVCWFDEFWWCECNPYPKIPMLGPNWKLGRVPTRVGICPIEIYVFESNWESFCVFPPPPSYYFWTFLTNPTWFEVVFVFSANEPTSDGFYPRLAIL